MFLAARGKWGVTWRRDILENWHITEQTLVGLDFKYSKQILAALLPMGLTVIFHGLGIDQVHSFFRRFGRPVMRGPHRTARTAVIIGVVAILLVSHFVGVVVWAAFYFLTDLTRDMSQAMLYSINAFSTMGDSNVVLPKSWLGFGNFEAMTAMLMFGWSTAVLADIVGKFHNIDE
ncbi:MAG: hypothetical protein ACOYB3_09590 [Azonexus sp.]